MTEEPTELTVTPKVPLLSQGRGLVLNTLDEMWRFALCVCKTELVPKGQGTPEKVIVALQTGLEIGLSPMQSLQGIAVINGKATVMGDTALALMRASDKLEYAKEAYEGTKGTDSWTAVFTSKRKGDIEEHSSRFSVADATLARLWGKAGPWVQYPDRMLMYRAKGFNSRDYWSDVLKGLHLFEEFIGHAPLANGAAELPTREERAEEVEQPAVSDALNRVIAAMTELMAPAYKDIDLEDEERAKVITVAVTDLATRVSDLTPEQADEPANWTDELADKCIAELKVSGLDARWLPGVQQGVPDMAGQQDLPLEGVK